MQTKPPLLIDVLVDNLFVDSKAAARRLFTQGGVKVLTGYIHAGMVYRRYEPIHDFSHRVMSTDVIKLGKRRFFEIGYDYEVIRRDSIPPDWLETDPP